MGKRNIRQLNSSFMRRAIAWGSWSTALVATNAVLAKPSASAATPPSAASTTSASGSAASNSSAAGQASVEASTPGEKRAAKLASDATGADFRAGRHPAAEKKLREAIQICMVQSCSDAFKARLHRDLGFVYVAGMKRVEDGKDEFTAALTTDSTVVLTPAMEEKPAVKQAFGEVKGAMSSAQTSPATSDAETSAAKEESEPEEKPGAKDSKQADSEASPDTAAPPEVKSARAFLNWFSLAIEQDIVLHSQTPNACSTGSRYTCFDRQGRQVPVNNFVPGGNQVSGGLASGTWRILLGYDRVFANRFSVGLKIGSVISGKPEIAAGQSGFKYFHAEGRAALWLTRDPFATSGLRPYVFLSGGLAETASKILVEYSSTDCPGCKLNAYKRSGYEFVGAGAGIQYAITPRTGPTLEARYMQFFGPAVPAIGVQLGYAFGI